MTVKVEICALSNYLLWIPGIANCKCSRLRCAIRQPIYIQHTYICTYIYRTFDPPLNVPFHDKLSSNSCTERSLSHEYSFHNSVSYRSWLLFVSFSLFRSKYSLFSPCFILVFPCTPLCRATANSHRPSAGANNVPRQMGDVAKVRWLARRRCGKGMLTLCRAVFVDQRTRVLVDRIAHCALQHFTYFDNANNPLDSMHPPNNTAPRRSRIIERSRER